MNPGQLQPVVETVWLWVAAPLAAAAAVALTVRLKLPQLLQLPAAFRALHGHDDAADGSLHPATSVALSTVAAYGAAAAVGTATAISLGGAGAIAWVWVFSLLLAPLRMAEAVLSRTAPPGRAGERTGTLTGRLLHDPAAGVRAVGWLLLVLVPIVAFAFVGGTHGEAVLDAAEELLPGSALTLGMLVAGVGAAAAVAPQRRVGSVLGWIAVVSLTAMFGAGLVAMFSDVGRGFGALGRAVMDAIYDAPRSGAWSGALAGEIAMAAMLHVLPPMAAPGGVEGALHGEAQAATTKQQAVAALLAPFVYALLTTVVGVSLIATNAFTRPIEDTRPIEELTFYETGFETTSQRLEESRLYTGFIRAIDGDTGVVEIDVATPRGMIRTPFFEDGGEPANVALHVVDGRVDALQKPGELGALQSRPLAELANLEVRGRMLPDGGKLLATSMTRGGGAIVSRVALAALLLLAILGVAAWGLGVAKTLSAKLPASTARWAALLPAAGLAVCAGGVIRGFASVGLIAAGALTVASSVGLLVRAKDVAAIMGGGARRNPASRPARAGQRKKRMKQS